MKKILLMFVLIALSTGCDTKEKPSSIDPIKWEEREVTKGKLPDSLESGKSYLSIYSQIFSLTEHKTHNLTVMVSLRNTSDTDTIYMDTARYYDTHGKRIHDYFKNTIYLAPLETLEIVIDEMDTAGGTGGNFIFDWKIPRSSPEPLFEAVMSSTTSQQGLSFITEAKRID
ncbi:DUF3124 domain-containing protein [Flavimarina sp. Hel_I_48]|uniref:DUF3124 domain-containing protein n=1 Tax=Flavimarina sp. Hel_I_48 TaxID=1392488 RepID=UPI0004DF0284|nr:DUF3124 domain-containing protein [Flavimarina sp. Hel_I_48]